MSRSPSLMQMVMRSPVLWGLALTVGFYAALDAELFTHPLITRFLTSHWAAYIEVAMFFVGVAALVFKSLEIAGQFEVLRLTYFDPAPPQGQPLTDCAGLKIRLDKQPARVQESYLFGRLHSAIDYLARKASTDTFEDELRALAEADAARKQASYGTLRMMTWTIPFVGSLGTVVGFGTAVANMAPDAGGDLLAALRPGLATAFDTTALALGLSVILMLGMFACDQIESRLLEAVDARTERELVSRFKGGSSNKGGGGGPAAPAGNISELFREAVEKLMERQNELWQASMQAASKQWEEQAALLKGQLENTRAASGGGGGGGGSFAGMPGDAAAWQEALARSGGFGGHHGDMPIQHEIMQQLIEAIEQESSNWPVRRSKLFRAGAAGPAAEFAASW